MSTIADELILLNNGKIDISAAILEKGGSVPSRFAEYGDAIRNLPSEIVDTTIDNIENAITINTIKIPEGTKKIGAYSFSNISSNIAIEIPKTVVQVDPHAFDGSPYITISKAPVIFKDIANYITLPLISEYSTSGMADGNYTSVDFNGVTWNYRVTNEMATITGMNENGVADITVPEFFGDTPVRRIQSSGSGGGAFHNKTMRSIYLPHTLTGIISSYNFLSCKNLSSIDIPDTIIELGAYSFQHCVGLISAHFPGSLSAVPTAAFYGCSNLSTIQIDEGVKQFGTNAFIYSGLTEIELPKTYIGQSGLGRCFAECKQLTSFTSKECEVLSVTQMFRGNSNLTTLLIPKVKVLGRLNGTSSAQAQPDMQLSSLRYLNLPSIETILSRTFGYTSTQLYMPNLKNLFIKNKPYREIVNMEYYDLWNLPSDCVIHARDRNFYYRT